jgi:NADPH:quinone reductase-like Zn-dependent oxidoreductase
MMKGLAAVVMRAGKRMEIQRMEMTEVTSDVVVRVRAAAVNPLDVETATGQYGSELFKLTDAYVRGGERGGGEEEEEEVEEEEDAVHKGKDVRSTRTKRWEGLVLGREAVGTVVRTSANAMEFKPGDDVVVVVDPRMQGCFADYVAVNEHSCIHKPSSLSLLQSASYPYGSLTAWQAVKAAQIVSRRDIPLRILVNGATGAVGLPLIGLLHHFSHGTACIHATCSSATSKLLDSLRVDRVWDYNRPDDYALEPYDIVFDTIGGSENEMRFRRLLSQSGNTAATSVYDKQLISFRGPLLNKIDSYGVALGTLATAAEYFTSRLIASPNVVTKYVLFRNDKHALRTVTRLIEEGVLMPPVVDIEAADMLRGGVADIPSAIELYQKNRRKGKIVVSMNIINE